ncbi:DsbA family protein [Nocardioides litoris]|uniref:mycothiol-dependent nitroreductase Rv2466c family protein n=1 Tax=Nocardioides litoris TaxID=1926648 RepID=UPI001120B545|nr:DsbA family protein [Nocardioides litoris]
MGAPDVRFWFDPVCPFAWLTSRWVRSVRAQRGPGGFAVEWRFISLRLLNAHVDYDAHFPPEYEAGHTAGLRLLRVCAQVRDDHGNDGVDALYDALGRRTFDSPPAGSGPGDPGDPAALLTDALAAAGLPAGLVDHLDDTDRDAQLQAETDEALALTGKDVGTPILHVAPPEGAAFFGPVISRVPAEEDAVRLWEHVVGLATFPGFAELKRSLREQPQLRSFGVGDGAVGVQEDWHAGSRRLREDKG